MTLREKVARALAIEDDEEFGEHSWDAYLPMADAAIAVCQEHFAGIFEANELPVNVCPCDLGGLRAELSLIASAIREGA